MYGYFRVNRAYFIALVGVCFAFFSVSSLAVTIDLGPSDFRTFGPNGTHSGAGIRTMRSQPLGGVINTLTRPSNLPAVVNRPSVVPYSSVAQGLRSFVRVNPASLAASAAVAAIFVAVDWVFDQSTGEWMKEGEGEIIEGTGIWRIPRGTTYSTLEDACVAIANPETSVWTYSRSEVEERTDGNPVGYCFGYDRGGTNEQQYTNLRQANLCPVDTRFSTELGACVGEGDLIVLSPTDWTELESELPQLPPGQVSDAAGDTMRRLGDPLPGYQDQTIEGPASLTGETSTTTTTNSETGQSTITETTTITNFNYGDTTITTTDTTTTTNYNSDGSVSSETVTEVSSGDQVVTPTSPSMDWPDFCDWAKVVCDWFDWTQDGWDQEEPEFDIIDFEPDGDYQIGGAGVCPAPYMLNIGWQINKSLSVSYQPFCDFGSLVKPLFLAFCYLFSGVIIVRSL